MTVRAVSCRVFAAFFAEADRSGAGGEALADGTGHPESALRDTERWVSWDVCHRICRNAGSLWDDTTIREIGRSIPFSPVAVSFTRSVPLFDSAEELYRWMAHPERGPTSQFVRCSRYDFRELEPGTLELTFNLDEGLEPSREYGLLAAGAMSAIPRLMELGDARVDVEFHSHGHRLRVHLPKPAGWWSRLRRRLRLLRDSQSIVRELREAYGSLYQSHVALQAEAEFRARAEADLRERERWLGALLEQAPVAIFGLDRDGNITRSDGSALRALDLEDGERVGDNVLDLYRDHPTIPQDTRRALQGEAFATRVEVGDATYDVWITPDHDEHGEPDGALGIVVDRTEILRAEKAREDTEGDYEQLLEQARNGVVIVDAGGRFLRTNQPFRKMLGYTEAELAELDVCAVSHPGDLALTRAILETSDPFQSVTKRYLRKDGTTVWAETSTISISSADAGPRRLAIVRDVSHHRRTERRLLESEALLRAAFDAAPYEIWAMDTDHRFTMQNSVCRQTWGDLVGKPSETLDLPDTTLRMFRAEEERAMRGETVAGEYQHVVNGEVREFADILSPIWVNGEIQGLVGINLDITERRREERRRHTLELEVRRRDRMQSLGTLAGGIAHDFNNVLTAMLGNAQLAERKIPPQDDTQRNLNEIVSAGKRARDLVEQILAFSRSEPGFREPVRIRDIVDEALQFLRATLPKSVDLWERLEAEDAVVNGNATQIYQVAV
ncbi:MAG: PAS domain S-box protein, partial [Gemmatimonadetes bacterium]|nr:PAS domain S-box protein [Gemmatimonadota bacterium]